jgi:hypothetical protein
MRRALRLNAECGTSAYEGKLQVAEHTLGTGAGKLSAAATAASVGQQVTQRHLDVRVARQCLPQP